MQRGKEKLSGILSSNMQTRLRSRLGLSGSDELPDPITKARGIESSSSTSTSLRRQSSSLDHNSLSTPVTPLVTPPPANTSGKLRVKRTLSAAGATPPGASVEVLGAPSHAHVHHQHALDASQHRFDHVDAKTVVPRTQWRRVFSHFNSHNNNHVASASPQPQQQQTVLFTPLSYHALQLDRRAQVQCSLQGTLLHALHRIRHEQRLGMLAADQETEFRDDILREARERKRRRKEGIFSTDGSSAGTSSDRKKFVIVDSDESDGIGQEVEELISAPGGGSTRTSAKKATNNRKEVVAHGVDYYNDDDDDSGALRILKVIDRLDIKLESFAKRNAELAANYVRTADNEAPPIRGGRGSRRILLGGKGRRVGGAASSGGMDNNNAGGVVWSPVMVEQGTVQTDIYPRLLPFQKEGIHWMVDTVLVRRLNCVLADEMGLGKTVSTIALASSLSQVKTIFVHDPTNAELIVNARRNVVLPSTAKISKAAEQGSSPSTKSFGVAKRARRAGRNAHTVSDSSNDDENSDDIDDTDDPGDISESEETLPKGRRTSKATSTASTTTTTTLPTSHARSSVVSAAVFDAAVPCPWAIAPTLVVAPLSTLPNWAAEFQNFEPNRFRVFTINGSREDREEQLDEFFTLLMALHGVSLRTTTSAGGRGRGGRRGARGDKKRSTSTTTTFTLSDRVMWGDVDPLQGAPNPIPVLLMPHDYFARALDTRGRRLVQHVQWELIVVDEAQRIKSNQSKLFQILHGIRSHHRLALSGTPLQNNVLEMFSLMEFILPDMFRSSDEGTKTLTTMLHEALRDASTTTTTTSSRSSGGKKLANPNCSSSMTLQEKEEELAFENQELQMLLCRRVHKLLSPFFLRREKSSVMSQLPKKDDIVVVCPLTRLQERFLATLERKRDQRLLSGNFTSAARKVVIHPYLILNSFYVEERMIYTSGKYMVLDAVLRFLHQHNHKTLVFCSWVKVLDIVDSMLTMQKIPFVRLEGRTQVEDREKNIKKFSRMSSSTSTPNTPTTATNTEVMVISSSSGEASGVPSRSSPSQESESPVTTTAVSDASSWPTAASQQHDRQRIDAEEVEVVEDEPINCFLISKIAGGVGLNLQVADTVILLDTDYNPQRDAQALARVYRVGQTKHVKVLRLVTNHPVEVRMMQVASNKHQLEEVVVKAGRYDLKSSGSDRDQHVRSAFETMNHNIGDHPLLQQQQHESTLVGSPVEQMDDDASLIDDHHDHRNNNNNNDHWNATTNLITSQLLDSIPRSEEERAAFGVFLQQHWQHLKDAEARDAGLDVSEEEAAWLRGS